MKEKIEKLHPIDEVTLNHQTEVAIICAKMGTDIGLEECQLNQLIEAAKIHDIGKAGVPQDLLNKKGKPSILEFEMIKRHPIIGYKICKRAKIDDQICQLVKNHHEKLDGTGYPNNLEKNDISLINRILSAADVYEALRAERQYKPKMSHEKAMDILENDFKNQIDPFVIKTLDKVMNSEQNYSVEKKFYLSKSIEFAVDKKAIERLNKYILKMNKEITLNQER